MRIEIDLPDESVNPSFRARARQLVIDALTHGERTVWEAVRDALEPATCGAVWKLERWRIEATCDLPPGHDGTHRCRLDDEADARIRWNGGKPDPGWVPHMVDDPELGCGYTWTHDDGTGGGEVEHTCTIYPHHDGDHIDGSTGRRRSPA